MSILWTYFWPIFAAALVCGLIGGRDRLRTSEAPPCRAGRRR